MTLKTFRKLTDAFPDSPKMPSLFLGHGNPMNAIEDNAYSRAWRALGPTLPRPNAVLCVSAHWYVEGTFVHAAAKPRTIHDFWGFPPELYAMRYPCPGSPQGAEEVRRTVKKIDILADAEWGLDHGAWVLMTHLFPAADVPVFQLSIDYTKPARFHYDLGKELGALRRKGVLIVGSGNLVHNLGMIGYEEDAEPYDWAAAFDGLAKKLILDGDHEALIAYEKLGPTAHLAVPTPDHYLPLLYTLALREKNEKPVFPVEGISNGSISMRGVMIGG